MINQHMGLNYHLWLNFRPQTLRILHPENLCILKSCFKVGYDHCNCLPGLFQQHPCQPFISNTFCCILASVGTVILPKAHVSSNCTEFEVFPCYGPWTISAPHVIRLFPICTLNSSHFRSILAFPSAPLNSFHLAFGLGAFFPRLLFEPFLNVNRFLESLACSLNGIRFFPLSLYSTLYLFFSPLYPVVY